MDTKPNRATTVAVVAGIVALLLGLCLGALVGGAGGYLIGRRVAPRPAELIVPAALPTPSIFELPGVPGLRGRGWLRMSGALVREVIADSPASEAGLAADDVIIAIDDMPIDAHHRLADVLGQYRPGDRVSVEVWRAGALRTFEVTLAALPDDPAKAYLGVYYIDSSMFREGPAWGD